MPLYALDDLGDALDATRGFLLPVERARWIKIALVTLFVGGPAMSAFSSSMGGSGTDGALPDPVPEINLEPGTWALIAAGIAILLLLGLAFALIGSVMEFVFVESLRREEVSVRRYWSRRWRQGLRLFGFRLAIGAFLVGSGLLLAAPFVLPLVGVDLLGGGLPFVFLLGLVPVFVLIAVIVGLVDSFTTAFVVPVMIREDRGVLDGWRRLWPTITAQWKQFLAYVIAVFVLSILGGILIGIATALGALVLLVPFGLLFAMGFGLFALVAEPLGLAVLVLVGITYVLAVIAVAILVQMPVKVYLRYYALLILGDVEPDFDLVADQRVGPGDTTGGA